MRAVGVLILVAILVVAVETVHSPDQITQEPFRSPGEDETADMREAVRVFSDELQNAVIAEIGQPIEGYEPQMFMQVYPGLHPEDFDGVDAQIGHYTYVRGELTHELGDVDVVHSAAQAITREGMVTLFENIRERLDLAGDADADMVIAVLQSSADLDGGNELVACTADAKQCPDGSYVGRVGPDCAFAVCPGSDHEPDVTVCTDALKNTQFCTMEYAPVCGLVQIQCITEPCNPVPETFSNGCSACAAGNVISYTDGACEVQE